jgi:DNA-binding CsgD family transcriptional regulator
VGRHADLAALLEERPAALGPGATATLITGPAGIGKTHLARRAAARLQERGYEREDIIGGISLTGVPLGAWAHLVPVGDREVSLTALMVATLDRVRSRTAGGARLVVVVDGAETLDDASAALVGHLAATPRLTVLVTARQGAKLPSPLAALVRDGVLRTMTLAPLDPGEVAELGCVLLGAPLDPASALRLYETTGGNPLWVTELLRAAQSKSALTETPGGIRVDTNLAVGGLDRLLTERLSDLTDAQRDAVELLAVGGALPIGFLEGLVGNEAPAALSRAGLISIAGGTAILPAVRLAHPLHRQCVLNELDPLTTRALLRRLVARAAEAPELDQPTLLRVALWHAELGEPFDPSALARAAQAAHWGLLDLMRRHLSGEAVSPTDAAFALEHEGADDRALVAVRLALRAWQLEPTFASGLALARLLTNRPEQAQHMVPLLPSLEALATDDAQRAAVAINRGIWRCWAVGEREAALEGLARDEALSADPWKAAITATRAGLMIQCGAVQAGLSLLEDATPPEGAPPVVSLLHASPLAAGYHLSGRLEDALGLASESVPLALELGDEGYMALAELVISQHWSQMCLGRYQEAARSCRDVVAILAGADNDEGRALFTGLEARCLLLAGQPATAAALLGEAIRFHGPLSSLGFRPLLHTTRAVALSWLGRLEEAAMEVSEARRWHQPHRFFDSELELAEATVASAHGRPTRAVELLSAARDGDMDRGCWYYAFLTASLLVRIQPETAHLKVLEDVASRMDGPSAGLTVAYGRALNSRDIAGLEEVADGLLATEDRLLALEALDAAVAAAQEGASRAHRVRLEVRLARLRAECEDAISPLRPMVNVPPGLTRREMEIASLAAEGLTSAAIAARLVLSVRTVESHLYRAFAKLGVRTRAELPGALVRSR